MPLRSQFAGKFDAGPLSIRAVDCYRQPGWHVWCGSLVQDQEGSYHLFYSRWPTEAGYMAWVTHSEIARAVGRSPAGPFEYAGPVLSRKPGGKEWDASCFHNVAVRRFNGRYYLYYTGNCGNGDWWEHRNRQRIGVAVADRPEGPWKRPDRPVLDVSEDGWDALMVSNPSVTETQDGRYLMIYKGVEKKTLPQGGRVLHGVAWADQPDGPFHKHPEPIFAWEGAEFPFEDPCVWREENSYFCLLKDMKGYATPSRESGMVLMGSKNGIHWAPAGPFYIMGRELPFAHGIQRFERVERPQLYQDREGFFLIVAVKPLEPEAESFNIRLRYGRISGETSAV